MWGGGSKDNVFNTCVVVVCRGNTARRRESLSKTQLEQVHMGEGQDEG